VIGRGVDDTETPEAWKSLKAEDDDGDDYDDD